MRESNEKKINIQLMITAVFAAVISIPVIYKMTFGGNSDMGAHIDFILKGAKTGSWPAYFLYHYTVYLLALCSSKRVYIYWASIIVLSVAIIFKALISFRYLNNELERPKLAIVLSLSLIYVMPIFNWWKFPHVYLGQLAPNIWHNPTYIFAMPFSLFLFYYAIKALEKFQVKGLVIVGLLLVLNTFAKPNFLLAFLPAFVLLFIYQFFVKYRISHITISKSFLYLFIMFMPVVLVLLIQYMLVFGHGNADNSGVIFAPLKVWKLYSPNIPASILLSTLFPMLYTLLYLRNIDRNTILSWMIFGIALLQYIFLAESGPRFIHGNFAWGVYASLYVLFLNCTASFFKRNYSLKFSIVFISFIMHFITGIYFYYEQIKGMGFLG